MAVHIAELSRISEESFDCNTCFEPNRDQDDFFSDLVYQARRSKHAPTVGPPSEDPNVHMRPPCFELLNSLVKKGSPPSLVGREDVDPETIVSRNDSAVSCKRNVGAVAEEKRRQRYQHQDEKRLMV